MKKQGICWLSVFSLLVSAGGFALFAVVLSQPQNAKFFYYAWVLAMVASPFIPLIAKRIRTKNNQLGKTCEIIAMVIAFFNVDCLFTYVLMLSSSWTTWGALLFCIIAYKIVPAAEPSVAQSSSLMNEKQVLETETVTDYTQSSPTSTTKEFEVHAEESEAEITDNHVSSSASSDMCKQQYCRFCGAKLREDSRFCHQCGKNLQI